MAEGKLVTISELARLSGISRQTLHRDIAAGRLEPTTRNEKGHALFDPAITLKNLAIDRKKYLSRHRDGKKKGGRPPKNPPPQQDIDPTEIPELAEFDKSLGLGGVLEGITDTLPNNSLDRADLAVKIARARLGILAVKEKEGELIVVDEVRKQGVKLAAQVVGALSSIPGRLAQQFSAMTDANAIHAMLEDEINRSINLVRKHFKYSEDGGDDEVEEEVEETE